MSEQTTVKTSAGQAAKAGLFGALGVISAPVLIVIILIVLCFVCFICFSVAGAGENLKEFSELGENIDTQPSPIASTQDSNHTLVPTSNIPETKTLINLESIVGKNIQDIRNLYPNGEYNEFTNPQNGVKSKSYRYETEQYRLTIEDDQDSIVVLATLNLKNFSNCKADNTILQKVDSLLPYGGFDPSKKGGQTGNAVSFGSAFYANYKSGYMVGASCASDGENYEVFFMEDKY